MRCMIMNSSIFILVFLHLCCLSLLFMLRFGVCTDIVCIPSERDTLLKLKHHLNDSSNRLSSWNATANSNCCQWPGVVCNNVTAHVVQLHLNTPPPNFKEYGFDRAGYDEALEAYERSQLGGEINPCLVDLKHLNYLDLSGNYLLGAGMPIPSFLGAMTSLTHLNLSYAGFMGKIPYQIGNLSNLLYLDLGYAANGTIPSQIGNLSNLLYLNLRGHYYDEPLFAENLDRLSSLSKLRYLDLSGNLFHEGGMPIPTFFCAMTSLTHLDLSGGGFYGKIPPQIGNLSNLVYLDLSYAANGTIPSQIGNLSNLLYLNLRGANLSKSFHWLHTLQALPSLTDLRLSECMLPHYNQPSLVNFSSLHTLHLSYTHYSPAVSFVPKWIFELKKLVSLQLQGNQIQGSIPGGIQNLTLLENLDLSGNSFSSSIPDWLHSLHRLKFLNLRYNNLHGTISDAMGNLSSLVRLDLSNNQLEGPIPTSLGNLCMLREIDFSYLKLKQEVNEILDILVPCISHGLTTLKAESSQLSGNMTDQIGVFKNIVSLDFRSNSIHGELPRSFGKLSSLRYLDLAENQFTGNPFESLGSLSKLSYLRIGRNHFQGVVKEEDLANLTSLKWFYALGNNLTLNVGPNWLPSFQLTRLDVSMWQIGPKFPSWIQSLNKLEVLGMANIGILDFIPTWFWETFPQGTYLNLSYNHIHGALTKSLTNPISFTFFDLSSNHLHGKLPYLYDQVQWLDLSSNSFSESMTDFLCNKQLKQSELQLLNLASNNLSGKIPDCWAKWPNLMVVNLESNHFVGNLPTSIGSLARLQSLKIRNNSLSGIFPTVLKKNNQLISLDLGENHLSGNIPTWVGERLLNMKILRLRSNSFSGNIPNEICDMIFLQDLDLAQNSLSGNIPNCFNHLNAMLHKKKSTNLFIYSNATSWFMGDDTISMLLWIKGRALEYNSILGLVTNVDLSGNNLSGEIPREITDLDGLIYLNLSKNQLSGQIPSSIGNMRSLESIDISRNQFSGEIPPTISNLSFLSKLDMSYNHLKGKIPTGTQMQSFEASNFVGNNLCGPPLPINCSSNQQIPDTDLIRTENDGHGVNWFFVSMALGFVVGFWVVVAPLFIYRSWRYAYFCFFDDMWYKLQSFF